MSPSSSAGPTAESADAPKSKFGTDCLTCRVVGATVFAGTGVYVLAQRKGTTGVTRHIMTFVACASFGASALRLLAGDIQPPSPGGKDGGVSQ